VRWLTTVEVSVDLDSARRDWVDGSRRLATAARDPLQAERLHRQVDVVTEELRRRVGGMFTLAQLAQAYGTSERWVREAIEERAASPGWVRTLTVVTDAAFHRFERGAVDYEP
jgi:hypothetical protein